jgi:hypothetical protein
LYNVEDFMPARQTAPCMLCRQIIEISDAGAAFTTMVRLVGVPDMPRFYESLGIPDPPKQETGQAYMCIECCVELAMGKIPPPSQPLQILAHELISRMTGRNPAILMAAWQDLRERVGLPRINMRPSLGEGTVLMPPKRLQPAG